MERAEDLAAIVLAGGRSRRMGYDKVRIAQPDGRPLIAHVLSCVRRLCREVLVVGDRPERFLQLDLPVPIVCDIVPDAGPLGAIYTGLGCTRSRYSLVVGCDMPFLNLDLLRYMAALPRDYEVLVPEYDGRLHPLHAIYSAAVFPVLEEALQQGERELKQVLERLKLRRLSSAEVEAIDPHAYSLFNLNEPQDVERAAEIHRQLEAARRRSST
ncbi:MAG TPA: molybdenum cofactor guanylyltransferase [Dehalococcoidia bacterium]|nr:molybdenum cofactor guanylyltransferase [Dehalococcoidia bacterium]